jgi:hypothetical protein
MEHAHTLLVPPKVNDVAPVASDIAGKTVLLAATVDSREEQYDLPFAYVDEEGYEATTENPYQNVAPAALAKPEACHQQPGYSVMSETLVASLPWLG